MEIFLLTFRDLILCQILKTSQLNKNQKKSTIFTTLAKLIFHHNNTKKLLINKNKIRLFNKQVKYFFLELHKFINFF